jgi:hypothetical protein
MPSAGFDCRCTTIQAVAEEAERRGGVTPFSDILPDAGRGFSVCADDTGKTASAIKNTGPTAVAFHGKNSSAISA